MSGLESLLKGNVVTGLAVGVGAAVLAPVLAPIVSSVGRPIAKSPIKAGLVAYEKSRETFAELGEVMDDLMAEARSEMATATTGGSLVMPATEYHAAEASDTPGEDAESEATVETPANSTRARRGRRSNAT